MTELKRTYKQAKASERQKVSKYKAWIIKVPKKISLSF